MQKMIYIVEDEADIAELIAIKLQSAGFDTRVFCHGTPMLQALESIPCDLLVLDLMLPDIDGMQICSRIREHPKYKALPIVMLTARVDVTDKVKGLNMGADDYLGKPFEGRELVARVKAVLRRSETNSTIQEIIVEPSLKLDLNRYEVSIDQERIDLTLTEFRILKLLVSNPGKVYSRSSILDHLWGTDKIVIERSVDVHIKNLREKISDYSRYIQNVRGVGYCFSKN
ncbi:MAG: response regulator transcription factor [Candidatus Cloacimonetes bacterium]|nr:response regulator transcription factor [Candidatus Cloacimonadota bacterium]MDD2507142.1 response regulator transcription factor [Candidatus Cloacimonadota bacterium]MDD4560659.1 response regulator transcription factor [Candidatus Cloacimonadota bacterium]